MYKLFLNFKILFSITLFLSFFFANIHTFANSNHKMKLVIDIGNTLVKTGLFEKKQLLETKISPELTLGFITSIADQNKTITSVIISSVKEVPAEIIKYLRKKFSFIELSESIAIPITNLYKTPGSLGKDRLAGIVAVHSLYPTENVLVIDAGTCITYDSINAKGEYYGGSISPGLNMRFKALHTFTEKLPLVSLINFNELIGTDTNESILSGVINGLIAETDTIIERYKKLYSPLKIIICGGDSQFLVNRLKNSIFAIPDLVLIGLNEILDYNEL